MNKSQQSDEDLKDQIENTTDFNIAGDESEGEDVMDIDTAEKNTGINSDGIREIQSFTDE